MVGKGAAPRLRGPRPRATGLIRAGPPRRPGRRPNNKPAAVGHHLTRPCLDEARFDEETGQIMQLLALAGPEPLDGQPHCGTAHHARRIVEPLHVAAEPEHVIGGAAAPLTRPAAAPLGPGPGPP